MTPRVGDLWGVPRAFENRATVLLVQGVRLDRGYAACLWVGRRGGTRIPLPNFARIWPIIRHGAVTVFHRGQCTKGQALGYDLG